jgi:DNA-binding transcriptional regulator GbsR (MarR family)
VKGTVLPTREQSALADWERLVVDAVGNVIELWGFKANEGRIWALLYLRARPFTAAEIQQALGLSKGAVSMVTREAEQWGVLHRVREGAKAWRFAAETDFLSMIGRVVESREARFIARVKADLSQAEALARRSATREQIDRIVRMRRLAVLVDRAIAMFLKTALFDVAGALGILSGRALDDGGEPWPSQLQESSPATSKVESARSTHRPRRSSDTDPKT